MKLLHKEWIACEVELMTNGNVGEIAEVARRSQSDATVNENKWTNFRFSSTNIELLQLLKYSAMLVPPSCSFLSNYNELQRMLSSAI
jgi:hypothetical protein